MTKKGIISLLLLISCCFLITEARQIPTPVDLVFPQLDTENSRWIFFASACRPFGMVNLSPDTNADADWGSGYRYERDSIKFFSHIHGWQLSGVPVLPVNGEFQGHLGSKIYGSKYFVKRSNNWKNLYDAQTGWIRPKNKEGKWKEPFDQYQYNNGFVEANSAQTTWFVPHDLPGLAKMMGGNEKAAAKLDESFRTAEKLGFSSGNSHAQELHPEYRRIPINYGNQPSIQTAFVFNHIGHPWLAQYWSRQVVDKAFSALSTDRGFNGDEDQGLMGSLSVLMKIGLFEMNSGSETNPVVEIGSPIFNKITLHLNNIFYSGKTFEIEVKNNSPENVYIQRTEFNGKPQKNQWLLHKDIVSGGKLVLDMGANPNMNWVK